MQRWDYYTVTATWASGWQFGSDGRRLPVELYLKELGAIGWDLLAVVPHVVADDTVTLTHYFKRPIEE
jgi:hypothetical protein